MIAELLAEFVRRHDVMTPGQWEFIGVFWVLLIIFMIVYSRLRNRNYRNATACLRRQALEWGGVMGRSGMSMTFDHRGAQIFVAWGSWRDVRHVYCSFQQDAFPDLSFRVISNKGRSVPELLVRTSSPGIEVLEGFWVRSNNEPLLRRLLTPELQQNLLSYGPRLEIVFGATGVAAGYSYLGASALNFQYERGRLWIFMFKLSKHDADYDALIKTTLMFYEELDRVAHLTPPPAENDAMGSKL